MYSKKLSALNYVNINENFTDEQTFRSLIVFLEDKHIRHYKIEDRKNLRDTNSTSWISAFELYLKDISCPLDITDRRGLVDYLLGLAIHLEYSDNVDKYKRKNELMKKTGDNPLAKMDYNDESFVNGVYKLAKLLQIPHHPDHLVVLSAITILVKNKLSKEALLLLKKEGIKPCNAIPLNKIDLGFDTKDYITQDVSKILRLLHIQEIRRMQDVANEAIVATQRIIANPKTDTALGKVGI